MQQFKRGDRVQHADKSFGFFGVVLHASKLPTTWVQVRWTEYPGMEEGGEYNSIVRCHEIEAAHNGEAS